MKISLFLFLAFFFILACNPAEKETAAEQSTEQSEAMQVKKSTYKSSYLDYSNLPERLSGGVKIIPIETPAGTFNVWTKRVGNNPAIKVLLLHGGPGATHEYFECFDAFLPHAGVEYYYYDQLESFYSDKPSDKRLWSVDRYVDEVEQVRKALGLGKDNFYLLGHSWGGILGIEYALKYQENLKGLIISNMVPSIPDYIKYANDVLGPQLDPVVLAQIRKMEADGDYANPKYSELVFEHYYPEHVLRMPLEDWPNPVNRAFANINNDLYVTMQGPSEFGVVGDAKLKNWDRKDDLPKISVPTLSIGGAFDTMDPAQMEWMANQVQNGRYLHCATGSHMSMYDDQDTYIDGLIKFLKDVNKGAF